jgi:hypothetical protein
MSKVCPEIIIEYADPLAEYIYRVRYGDEKLLAMRESLASALGRMGVSTVEIANGNIHAITDSGEPFTVGQLAVLDEISIVNEALLLPDVGSYGKLFALVASGIIDHFSREMINDANLKVRFHELMTIHYPIFFHQISYLIDAGVITLTEADVRSLDNLKDCHGFHSRIIDPIKPGPVTVMGL